MPTLRVENVGKRFGGLAALDGVSLEARPGRVTSIIGQNGAGKTTLINAIAQLPPPDSGRIFVGDDELTGITNGGMAIRFICSRLVQLTSCFRPCHSVCVSVTVS